MAPGLRDLALADRATIANMSPEYGATCGIFPIDKETMRYLRLTGRSEEQIALVEAYAREQGIFHDEKTPEAEYSELLTLDLDTVEPSLAGPKRPQDRVLLSQAGESFNKALPSLIKPKPAKTEGRRSSSCNLGPDLPEVGQRHGLALEGQPKAEVLPPSAWKIRTCTNTFPRR